MRNRRVLSTLDGIPGLLDKIAADGYNVHEFVMRKAILRKS